MKKLFIFASLATLAVFVPQTADAQTFSSGYFLDNYVYQYRLNPAMHPEDNAKSIISVLIGDFTFAPKSNVGASAFLYPKNGELVSAFNEKVSVQEFMNNLPDVSDADLKMDWDLVTVGAKTKYGFFAIDVRLKSFTDASVSKDMFKYIKEGFNMNPGSTYQISNMAVSTKNYLELGGSYSFKVKNFRFGIGLKFLLGMTSMQSSLYDMNIYIRDKESGLLSGQTNIGLAAPVSFMTGTDGTVDYSRAQFNPKSVISGFGGAIDLGVFWDTPLKGLSVSAAVIDLGGISWKNALYGSATHNKTVFSTKDSDMTTSKVINTLYGVDPNNPGSSEWCALAATINAGLRYKMPFYDKLSVGAHGSFVTGSFPTYDIRFGLTVTPVNHVSVTANYGVTSYGGAFGLAANFRLGPIAIFGGVDGLITRFAPQGFPLDALNTVMKLGVTISPKTDALKMKKSKD